MGCSKIVTGIKRLGPARSRDRNECALGCMVAGVVVVCLYNVSSGGYAHVFSEFLHVLDETLFGFVRLSVT